MRELLPCEWVDNEGSRGRISPVVDGADGPRSAVAFLDAHPEGVYLTREQAKRLMLWLSAVVA